MKERAHIVAVLLRHELRMLLRDRRTVILSIIVPIAVMPFLLFINLALEKRREAKLEATTFSYCVTGSQAELARSLIADGLETQRADEEADNGPALKLEEKEVADPAAALRNEEIYFQIEAMRHDEWQQVVQEAKAQLEAEAEQPDDKEPDMDARLNVEAELEVPVPVMRLVYRTDWDASSSATRRVVRLLDDERNRRRHAALAEAGFPARVDLVAALEEHDVASQSQVAGSKLGKFLALMVMMFILMGGSVVATDSIAGEKERGTLETLLTTAAGRVEIVTAKQLAILSVALVITLIQAVNLLVYIVIGVIPVPDNMAFSISGGDAFLIFLLFVPAAAMAASVLLMISGKAGSYKEAQLLFFPIFLVTMAICAAPFLPGIELRSAIVLLPIANIAIAVKEVMAGIHDWPFLALAWAITAATAAWVIRLTHRSLATERLIAPPSREDLGVTKQDLFSSQVLRWFAVIWAIMFVAAGRFPTMQGQVLLNVVLLFGGGTLVMLRRYRLQPKQALALRAPRWPVWLAVIIGAPAGLIAGLGVFQLANMIFPVPEKLLESMGRALMPEEVPLWQLLLLICVLPGIFEELFFRGMLLHGLRRRLRPVPLSLVVGLIFGLFHFSLYRIAPTAYLGVLLSALTLLSGSIFPAMLWHFLHNAMSVLSGHFGIPLGDLDPWLYGAAAAVLAACFWIVYRNRRPYPGLRGEPRVAPSSAGEVKA